ILLSMLSGAAAVKRFFHGQGLSKANGSYCDVYFRYISLRVGAKRNKHGMRSTLSDRSMLSEAERIERGVGFSYFVVKVSAGRTTRTADSAEYIAAFDDLTEFYRD